MTYKEWKEKYPEHVKENSKRNWQREKERMATDPEFREKRKQQKARCTTDWRRRNREHVNAQRQARRCKNKEYCAYQKEWRRTHVEEQRAYQREWRKTHKEQQRIYIERNRERIREYNRRYYARKKQKQQLQLLQTKLSELLTARNTLERKCIYNEDMRLQWGWDMQQLRIKINKTQQQLLSTN